MSLLSVIHASCDAIHVVGTQEKGGNASTKVCTPELQPVTEHLASSNKYNTPSKGPVMFSAACCRLCSIGLMRTKNSSSILYSWTQY